MFDEGTQNYQLDERGWRNQIEVIQETEQTKFWSRELAEKWAANIPDYSELKPKANGLIELDLSHEGFGVVSIKNEGDLAVNPTGTIKDRLARIYVCIYKGLAKFYLKKLQENPEYEKALQAELLPRYSLITSGNAGMALASAFAKFELPPPKLLLDKTTPSEVMEKLQKLGADLYLTDLLVNPFSGKPAQEQPLSPGQILTITNNQTRLDITSAGLIDSLELPWADHGIELGQEIFPHRPDEVYTPYGTGMTFDGLVTYQFYFAEGRDVKILGAEPEIFPSVADKLAAPVKPYKKYDVSALTYMKQKRWTHNDTGVHKISEQEIKEAFELMIKYGKPFGMRVEPSGAAGMALYIQRKRLGQVPENAKVIVVNTGCGIISEKAA